MSNNNLPERRRGARDALQHARAGGQMRVLAVVCLLTFLAILGAMGDNMLVFVIGVAGFGLVPLIKD